MITCQFRKIIVVCSLLRSIKLSNHGFLVRSILPANISFCGVGFQSNRKVTDYPIALMLLLHPYAYLAVVIVVHRGHPWVDC